MLILEQCNLSTTLANATAEKEVNTIQFYFHKINSFSGYQICMQLDKLKNLFSYIVKLSGN
jgi:hypothetical protein